MSCRLPCGGDNGLGGGRLNRANRPVDIGGRTVPCQGCLEGLNLIGNPFPAQPYPHGRQRRPADLPGPRRGGAIDQKGLKRAENKPGGIVGARRGIVIRLPHHPAKLLKHKGGDGGVLAAFDGAFELAHQQCLRFRRQLREIVPQSIDRRLIHAPETLTPTDRRPEVHRA